MVIITGTRNEVVLFVVGVLSFAVTLTTIGSVMLYQRQYIANLPIGTAVTTNGTIRSDIGSISSSTEITPAQIEGVAGYFTIRFPPPPTLLNLKNQNEVRAWESVVGDARVDVHYDIDRLEAWTGPIDGSMGVVFVISGCAAVCCVIWVICHLRSVSEYMRAGGVSRWRRLLTLRKCRVRSRSIIVATAIEEAV